MIFVGWFSKKIDVEPIYKDCMASGNHKLISASDVSCVFSSPFSVFCKYHVDHTKMDPPDPFQKALAKKGLEHEDNIMKEDYPEIEQISYDTSEEGFMISLKNMADGKKTLAQFPLFYLPEGMHGYPDVLEKCKGKSIFGDYHYTVREIKVATNIKTEHKLQAAFYTFILGKIQQRTPDFFSITNGKQLTVKYPYLECVDLLLQCIRDARKICDGYKPPAIYGGSISPWINHANEIAISNNDISLIQGMGKSKRDILVNAGFNNVNDIAKSSPTQLEKIDKIGKITAKKYHDSARSISENIHIQKSKVELPVNSTEIFLDLEGLNPLFDDSISDYLIGVLVRKDDKENYYSFVAENKREDLMLYNFIDFLNRQQDFIIYHWHHYEKNHLLNLLTKYDKEDHLNLLNKMIDLYKVATKSFTFPTYSNSLKDIAKWMGFNWRHDNVGATSAIDLYLQYIEDPQAGKSGMNLVIDYNEDDCIATKIVKDWLVNNSDSP